MPKWMIAIAILGGAIALLAVSARAALGFSVGAIFGILNYYWLHQTVVALMSAESTRAPRSVVLKMLVRYPLCLAGIFWFYTTGRLPIMALVGGLLVPGAGILVETLFLISAGLREKSEARG
jgi:hypothetical protein